MLRRALGSLLPQALLLVALMFMLASLIVGATTFNLNLSGRESLERQALELAMAAIHDWIRNEEKRIESAPDPTIVIDEDVFDPLPAVLSVLPYPKPLSGRRPDPYIFDKTHMKGEAFITFSGDQGHFPWSTDNRFRSIPDKVNGFRKRIVPAFTVDLIATGVIGGVKKSVAAQVSRRWDYAVACNQRIILTSNGSDPCIVEGDLFSMSKVRVGRGCRVRGVVEVPVNAPDAITVEGRVDQMLRPDVGAERIDVRELPFPKLVSNPPTPDPGRPPPKDLIKAIRDGEFPGVTVVGASPNYLVTLPDELSLVGDWYVTGTVEFAGKQLSVSNGKLEVAGLKVPVDFKILLGQADLTIGSNFEMNDGTIEGEKCCVTVSGDMTLTNKSMLVIAKGSLAVSGRFSLIKGFIAGDPRRSFALTARDVYVEANGRFHGLIIVGSGMTLKKAPPAPPPTDAPTTTAPARGFSVVGAVLAGSNSNRSGTFILDSVSVYYDPNCLWALHKTCPYVICSLEELKWP